MIIRRPVTIAAVLFAALTCMLLALTSPARAWTRPAMLIGAAEAPYTVAGWQAGNDLIGPLQTQRIFYPFGQLPSSFTGSYCDQLEHANSNNLTCVISYKTPTTNVAAFVASIPARVHVIMIFHHEAEHPGAFSSGADFVSAFTAQAALIRQAAGCQGLTCHVQVGTAAMLWQYQGPSYTGYTCTYLPPPAATDFYLADIYEPSPNGQPLPSSPVAAQWNNWLACLAGINTGTPDPLGLAEYGLGTNNGDQARANTITADTSYLEATFPSLALWEYWDENNSTGSCTPSNCDWRIQGHPLPTTAWRAAETGNP